MTKSRVIIVTLVTSAVLLGGVGRWESQRWKAHENAGLETVFKAVGPLSTARPTGWRIGPPDCVAFSTTKNLVGLQLCFDRQGRLIESVDRRGAQPVYSSLVAVPSAAKIRVPLPSVKRMLPTIPN